MEPHDDIATVEDLLGRSAKAPFAIVVRNREDQPVVIRNAPFLSNGDPMPTLYWLVGRSEGVAVGALEASGGVNRAEAEISSDAIAAAHEDYAVERDAYIPDGTSGPRPRGGVGGTRQGVKCLHAHVAWFLARGCDPVGAWAAERAGIDASLYRVDLSTEYLRLDIVTPNSAVSGTTQ